MRLVGGNVETFRRNVRKTQVAARANNPEWSGPRAPYAAMSTSHRGATAKNVLVTSRERGWRAPSGKRANGVPNTTLKVALPMGRDKSADITGTKVDSLGGGKYPHVKIDGPNAGLTRDGRGRKYA